MTSRQFQTSHARPFKERKRVLSYFISLYVHRPRVYQPTHYYPSSPSALSLSFSSFLRYFHLLYVPVYLFSSLLPFPSQQLPLIFLHALGAFIPLPVTMDEDNSSMTATRKFGIRAPDSATSPVPAVEPSISSVPSYTGSLSATTNDAGLTDTSNLELLGLDRNRAQISQCSYLAVIPMTAYHVSTPYERIQFNILVTSFQKKTGMKLEKGKIYHIKGTIGSICAFEKEALQKFPTSHSGSRQVHGFDFARQEVRFGNCLNRREKVVRGCVKLVVFA